METPNSIESARRIRISAARGAIDKKFTKELKTRPSLSVTIQSYSYARQYDRYTATMAQTVCNSFDRLGYSVWFEPLGMFGGDGASFLSQILNFFLLHKDTILQIIRVSAIIKGLRASYNLINDLELRKAMTILKTSKIATHIWLNLTLPEPREGESDKGQDAVLALREIAWALPWLQSKLCEQFPDNSFTYNITYNITVNINGNMQFYLSVFLMQTLSWHQRH